MGTCVSLWFSCSVANNSGMRVERIPQHWRKNPNRVPPITDHSHILCLDLKIYPSDIKWWTLQCEKGCILSCLLRYSPLLLIFVSQNQWDGAPKMSFENHYARESMAKVRRGFLVRFPMNWLSTTLGRRPLPPLFWKKKWNTVKLLYRASAFSLR